MEKSDTSKNDILEMMKKEDIWEDVGATAIWVEVLAAD